METIKDILNFCNSAVFHDFTNIGITCESNQVRKCIINSFCKRIPHTRILVRLSIIDDITSKINNNDIEIILELIHGLREIILYMLSFEKLIRDEQQTIRPYLTEDEDQQKSYIVFLKGCKSKRILRENQTC